MTITSDKSARGIDSLYAELSEKFGQVYHIKRQKTESAGGQLGVFPSSPVPDTDSAHSVADLYEFVKISIVYAADTTITVCVRNTV